LILSSSFDFGCQTSALKNILWTLVIVMTFLVRECYGSPKKQEF
jgi:hypothetical protein